MTSRQFNMNDTARQLTSQVHDRVAVLDSYRALAALYVMVYHYFHRWTSEYTDEPLLPNVGGLAGHPFAENGILGVEFFFIISGYVISMTLQRTASFLEFTIKRFARLFPAMLVCSVATFIFMKLAGAGPLADVSWSDFVPSLTFTSPYIYNEIFGMESDWMSGVYWSLFVEVKFYVCIAIIYFVFRRRFFAVYTVFTAVTSIAYLAAHWSGMAGATAQMRLLLFPEFGFLFLAGIAFYELNQNEAQRSNAVHALIVISMLYTFVVNSFRMSPDPINAAIVVGAFYLLFYLFIFQHPLIRPLQARWLATVGAGSYSLYLIHESAGVSILHDLLALWNAPLVWIVVVALAMIAISQLIFRVVERPANRWIRRHVLTKLKTPTR